MLKAISELYRTGLVTPAGLWRVSRAALSGGLNPMVLLRVAAARFPDRVAVQDDQCRRTWSELYTRAESVARGLHAEYGVGRGTRLGIACRDHATTVESIFAACRLGANVTLLNPGTPTPQLLHLWEQLRLDLLIHDTGAGDEESSPGVRMVPVFHDSNVSIENLAAQSGAGPSRLPRANGGRIVVLTGGTTGRPKSAGRRPSVMTFLPPFGALLTSVKLARYRSVYIATPVFHGFGLASVFISVALGVTMHLSGRFDAARACRLIEERSVEAVTVVPLMLQRMLAQAPDSLASLSCIISGGAPLSPALATATLDQLGSLLFNMYGTSEAGVCIMATPEMLRAKPESIGRPIPGVRARIRDENERPLGANATGRLCIRSGWTTGRNRWIETGDLAWRDAEGDLHLCGRVDDMIVSGGENVYPVELENVLASHPDVEACAVIGVSDSEFGQRLHAFVQCHRDSSLAEEVLGQWLRSRVARHQFPARIEIRDSLPYTPLGKLDKRALAE